MTSTELQIKNIVYEEFSKLISNIEGDFKTNFVKKRYNFLLSQLDETITANMVFVSSFESKSGFAIETCAKRIARLKFGDENVPAIVNPRNVKHNINPNTISGQIIVTDIDTDKELFRNLLLHKDEIESVMGLVLDWRELPERKASRIIVEKEVTFDNRATWSQQFDYIMDVCMKMKKAFKKYL